ncbi:PTS sugar transporter subunit IIA [bacterium]|nr:PTS sugar transporter subunit IIA [bacterium]RKZ33280.1 MAG: PTS sugar transporter subunit IIA [bacterium]
MNDELAARMAARHLKLSQFCGFDLINLDLKSEDKEGVLRELAALLARSPNIESEEDAYNALLEREKLASTGMGLGVAVPHGKSSKCKALTIAFGRSIKGVDFDALDGSPVHLFFAVLVPISSVHLHLQILASLSLLLRDEKNREKLMNAQFPQEVLDLLDGKA